MKRNQETVSSLMAINYKNFVLNVIMICFLIIILFYITPDGYSLGTTFTYQGKLTDGGTPANNIYDFQFKLFNAETTGTQIGSTVLKGDVVVTNGLFAVEINFGVNAFNGYDRWLEIRVRPGTQTGAYTILTPRQKINPAPYAIYSSKSADADKLDGNDSTAFALTSHNHDNQYWNQTGNSGTTPGTNFIGTADDKALEVKVNNNRVMRYEPDTESPNIIGGYDQNIVSSGTMGATISGGGKISNVNKVTDSYGTIGGGRYNQAGNDDVDATNSPFATISGGYHNIASGYGATVPGGRDNVAGGTKSLAAGYRAKANHNGTFVWADGQDTDFASSGENQFLVRANGGVGINTDSPGSYGLRVSGQVGLNDNLDMGPDATNAKIVNVADPTNAQDVATRNYVDNTISASITTHNHWNGNWSGSGIGLNLLSNDSLGIRVGTNSAGGFGGYFKNYSGTGAYPGYGVVGLTGAGLETNLDVGFFDAGGGFVGPNGLIGVASSDSNIGHGLVGVTKATSSGAGVFGWAQGESGGNYGGYFRSSSDAGKGVYGEAGSGSGTTYGVYGRVSSSNGYAGYFSNTSVSSGIDIMADGSGKIKSRANNVFAANPMNMVTDYVDVNDVYYNHSAASTDVIPNITGTTDVYLPVDIPIQIFGVIQKLVNVQVTYKVTSSSSYITDTMVFSNTVTGSGVIHISDLTDRTSTSWTTYTITNPTPYTIDGSLFIKFKLSFSGTGTSHSISFGRITVTLTEN